MSLSKILPLFFGFLLGTAMSVLYFSYLKNDNSFSSNEIAPKTAPSKSEYDYPVRVSVYELGNRTVVAEVRGHKIISDQPKEFGADDKGPTPPELLASSFGTCIVATMQLLASQQNIQISDIKVEVDGVIDFSKAMGQPGKNRSGFQGLTAKISFNSTMSAPEKEAFIGKVSQIGAALDTIENKTPIQYLLQM